MTEQNAVDDVAKAGDPDFVPYDARRLSYANTFSDPSKIIIIRTIEWVTGKLPLLRRIRRFEKLGAPQGHGFFTQTLKVMNIAVTTPDAQTLKIPPLVRLLWWQTTRMG